MKNIELSRGSLLEMKISPEDKFSDSVDHDTDEWNTLFRRKINESK